MKEIRSKSVPAAKVERVKQLAERMKKVRTVLIASCRGLPSAQFHTIRKKLRDTAEIIMVKKNIAKRALEEVSKQSLKELEVHITADIAFFFSDKDAFALSAILAENQIPSKARAGDIAPEDIEVSPGMTDLAPGPAISELSGVGLKVAVKEGKLEIIRGGVVARKGEVIKDNVAGVVAKLGINPMKVGFVPIAAYDKENDKVYAGIKIDKEGTLRELSELIKKALGFAVMRNYYTKETINYFIAKASIEERAITRKINAEKTTMEVT